MIQPSPRSAIGLFSACLLSFLLIMMPFVQIAGASSETRSRLVSINETLSPPILGFVVTKVADTNDGTCDADCSLREAITQANLTGGADMITFNIDPGAGPHTIQLSSVLPALSESVDLLNSSGESISVRGEGASDPYRIFAINTGQTVGISNLTITNGAPNGAAVFPANVGGGILNEGTLTLTNCTVSGNTVTSIGGGGIYNFGAGATLNLNSSTVSGNHALTSAFGDTPGGGIFNNGGTVTVTDSTISGNDAAGNSGGIHNDGGTLSLTRSTLSNNTANIGGGIVNFGTLTLTNSTISGNNANSDGGGLYINASGATFTSVTFSNNRADNDNNGTGTGGGMFIFAGTPLLRNTIVAGNFNEGGVTDTADNIAGTVSATSSFNLIGTGSAGGLTNGVNNNQVGVASPGLGSLGANGGPTQTHALQSGSPAIDKGDDFGLATDQRGVSRPVDDPAVTNAAQGEDIGAFEAPLPAPVLTIAKDFSNPGNDPADSPEETATAGTTGNTFFIIVTNTGASTANNVVITDLVPAALTVTNVTGTLGTQVANPTLNDNDISWSIATLNAGQSVTLTVTYSVGSGVDSQLVNNTATADSDETTPVSDGDDVQVNEAVTLTIAKDFSSPGNDSAGDTPEETVTAGSTGNTFFIIVTNTGISTADNVLISDVVPAALTVTNVSGTLGSEVPPAGDNTIQWSIPTLGAGQSVTLTVTYSVGSGVSTQLVINAASVVSDELGIPVTDSDDVQINAAIPSLTVQDAQVAEPSSGSVNMVFTVTLSAPAPAGGVTVNFTTQAQAPALNHATAGSDYATTSGTVSFAPGEQIKTINVPVLSDALNNEQNETFLVILAAPVNGNIADGTATGTILITNQAGTLLISELRTSGPAGAGDDFVEIYNNTDSPHVVNGIGGGYGVFKMGATCGDTPILLGVIPNGTTIPARGHFLFTGSAYSLANYGGSNAAAGDVTLAADIENDRNVSLFSTTDILALSTGTRFDAVGFGANVGGLCDLQREGSTLAAVSGSTLEYSFFRKMCDFVEGVGCSTPGNPKDTNNNVSDFLFADTTSASTPAGQLLGAPGPENLGSPRRGDPVAISVSLLDNTQAAAAVPNRVRNSSPDPGNNSTFGTLEFRRRIVNSTSAPVTKLRFRVVELTTTPAPVGKADLRARTLFDSTASGILDTSTCAAEPGSPAPPCIVTLRGTTLETPPAQPNGGGLNSTISSPTITLGTPLAPGASINVSFLVGVQQTGNFRFLIIVEALP